METRDATLISLRMLAEAHLLEHESELHPFFRHALHVQEAVELEVEFPLSFLLLFFAASESGGKDG